MPQNPKHGRLNQDMKREIIGIIGQMKDPRLSEGLLSVMRVDCTTDLSSAKVYISVLGRENATAEAVDCLKKAAGHVRTELSRRMHIHKAPELLFIPDDGAAYAAHINEVLKGIEHEQ